MKRKLLGTVFIAMALLTGCSAGSAGNTVQRDNTEAVKAEDEQVSGTQENETDIQSVENDTVDTAEASHVLVAYFSWSGNTREMAAYIAEQTGGDLYEIVPLTPYPDEYNATGEVAKQERDEDARPQIADLPETIEQYDTILLGYPIWWHTAPMIIGTFLNNYDLSGVDIYPFTQSASMNTEQFDNSMQFIKDNAGSANVHDGLFVTSTDMDGIRQYLEENGLSR